jgi:predicted nucleic-acid-binding protein
MRAVDTNVLVRAIVRDDPQQAAAADAFASAGAWVSVLVLAETIWTLASVYDFDSDAIVGTIDSFLKHRDFVLQDADIVSLALTRFRERPSLEFTDCLMLEVARKAGHLPLGTFDRPLGKGDGAEAI